MRGKILSLLALTLLTGGFGQGITAHTTSHCTMPEHAHAAIARYTSAITWVPVEVTCPVCQTKNTFLQWASFGGYIYQFPSKYQLVFFPHTDSPAWWSCRRCHLSVFLEDFGKIPADKVPAVRKSLADVRLPDVKDYQEIPTSQRIAVAEKVYRALGREGDEFWSLFYRVAGYHNHIEGKQPEAAAARRRALEIVERQLADKANDGRRKELLFISGSMRHLLKDNTGALKDFEAALGTKYNDKSATAEGNANAERYLTELLTDFKQLIQQGKTPPTGAHSH